MSDQFDSAPEGAGQPENESAPNGAGSPADPLDQELADLVSEVGPVSREAELEADLKRISAEFTNYKNRVDRDRDVSRNLAIAEVFRALLPALDDLALAESHGDLEGSPLQAVVTKIKAAGEKFGLVSFGAKGEVFDPEKHNALVQTPNPEVKETVIADVIALGYSLGDRLIRPAMVAVFIPEEK